MRSTTASSAELAPVPSRAVHADRPRRLRDRLPDADTLRARYATLSPRAREVFGLLAEGYGIKTVAYRLGVATKTVDAHACQVHARMALSDRLLITRAAYRLGLLQP